MALLSNIRQVSVKKVSKKESAMSLTGYAYAIIQPHNSKRQLLKPRLRL